jgi:hypothetical protein
MGAVAEKAVIGGLSALGGGVIGYIAGVWGKVTVSFVNVTGYPKGDTPEMLVIQETKRAIWIQDPDTSAMLKWLLNYTAPVASMRYEDFVRTYTVVTPGKLLWNKSAPSF